MASMDVQMRYERELAIVKRSAMPFQLLASRAEVMESCTVNSRHQAQDRRSAPPFKPQGLPNARLVH
jgi:hypothetical protein